MLGTVSEEMEVIVPASQAWQLYGTGLKLAKLAQQFVRKIELVEGDGGVGTVVKIVLPPGTFGFEWLKEKFTIIDDEKRVKKVEVIEGGYLDLGFTLFRVRFEVIEKGEDCCITRSTIEYDANEEAAVAMAQSTIPIQFLVTIMEACANKLINDDKK